MILFLWEMINAENEFFTELINLHKEQFKLSCQEAITAVSDSLKIQSNEIIDDIDIDLCSQNESGSSNGTCTNTCRKDQSLEDSSPQLVELIFLDDHIDDETQVVSQESVLYGHIESSHKGPMSLVVVDPASYENPNSRSRVADVLRKIGRRKGIHQYGGNKKFWTFICVDGLPYVHIVNLKKEAVICCICQSSFLCRKEFVTHHSEQHKGIAVSFLFEFDWVYIVIGLGHYEHNLLKAFFKLNWSPLLEMLAELCQV